LLPSRKALVIGGEGGPRKSAELYNPATGKWTYAGNLITARSGHSGNLLADGRIVVAGGFGEQSPARISPSTLPEFVDHGALSSAELGITSR